MRIEKDKKVNENKYQRSEKFKIGCEALGGKAVAEISKETGMSESHIYRQKVAVKQYAEDMDNGNAKEVPTLRIDERTIKNTVLVLSLANQSPLSGIKYFIKKIYGIDISVGTIHNILAEASGRAKEYDSKVELSNISQVAVDELFQCGEPILTGVDAESTYIFAMEPMNERTGEAWQLVLEVAKDRGLEPKVCISDAAKGLIAGVERTFGESEIQADTFHALYELGKEVSKCEKKANKYINAESELERKLKGAKPRNPEKLKQALEDNAPKMNEAISIYDHLSILYTWMRLLLGFSGYSQTDTQKLVVWVLQEMALLAVGKAGLLKEIEKIKNLVPQLLSFVTRLEKQLDEIAVNAGVPPDICRLVYRNLTYLPNCIQGIEEQCVIVNALQEKYTEVYNAIRTAMQSTKKASSLVENVNGRIRVYIEVKRVIPPQFFVLLKVYLNTRRYPRSRCAERIGKSPLELLTKTSQPEFLDIIGF